MECKEDEVKRFALEGAGKGAEVFKPRCFMHIKLVAVNFHTWRREEI